MGARPKAALHVLQGKRVEGEMVEVEVGDVEFVEVEGVDVGVVVEVAKVEGEVADVTVNPCSDDYVRARRDKKNTRNQTESLVFRK